MYRTVRLTARVFAANATCTGSFILVVPPVRAGRRFVYARLAHQTALLGLIRTAFHDAQTFGNLLLLGTLPRRTVLVFAKTTFTCFAFFVVEPALFTLAGGNSPVSFFF
jgi:hypothetical protein